MHRGLLLLLVLLVGVAHADEPTSPTATLGDDGVVTGVAVVSASPSEVLAKLNDPTWVAGLGDGSTRVTQVSRDGACQLLDYVSDHSIATVRYRVRQCEVEGGNRATLVDSKSFSAYGTSWTVSPQGSGSRIEYRLEVVSTLAVPQWIVRRTTRSSVLKLMELLARTF